MEWKSASAYVTGSRHRNENTPCQDRAHHEHTDLYSAIALSDGAGSCPLSHIGSELTVQSLIRLGHEHFDSLYQQDEATIAKKLEQILITELQQTADELSVPLSALSATLLFVLVKEERCIAGHIGDGVIGMRQGRRQSVLSHPENGRFLNETYFLTMAPLHQHFRIYKMTLTEPTDFILMSDGAASSLYWQSKRMLESRNVNTILDYLIEEPASPNVSNELEDLLQLLAENTDDDCSIAVMTSHTAEILLTLGPDNSEDIDNDSVDKQDSEIDNNTDPVTEEENESLSSVLMDETMLQDNEDTDTTCQSKQLSTDIVTGNNSTLPHFSGGAPRQINKFQGFYALFSISRRLMESFYRVLHSKHK